MLVLGIRKPTCWPCVGTTDIEKKPQNSYTVLCNDIVSHGAPVEGIVVFCRPHTQKQTQTKCVHNLCLPYGISRVFIFYAQTVVHMHLMNHGYLRLRVKPKYPKLEPYAGKRWCGFWDLRSISLVGTEGIYHDVKPSI